MSIRQFSSIGLPLGNAIKGRRFQSSLAESSLALTHLERAFLSEACPRALREALNHPWGFLATSDSLGFPATSGDLIVRTTFSISDGLRLSQRLAEYSRWPICRLFDLASEGLPLCLVDRSTGAIGREGAQLLRVSTLRATSQREAMRERVR
jgi:hypothetical protein